MGKGGLGDHAPFPIRSGRSMTRTGLTPFLVALIRTDPAALTRADPEKLAAKYGIRADWARFYIEQWRTR